MPGAPIAGGVDQGGTTLIESETLRSLAGALGARRVVLVEPGPGARQAGLHFTAAANGNGAERSAGGQHADALGSLFGSSPPAFAGTDVPGVFAWDARPAGGGHGLAVPIRAGRRLRGGIFAEFPEGEAPAGRADRMAEACRDLLERG